MCDTYCRLMLFRIGFLETVQSLNQDMHDAPKSIKNCGMTFETVLKRKVPEIKCCHDQLFVKMNDGEKICTSIMQTTVQTSFLLFTLLQQKN